MTGLLGKDDEIKVDMHEDGSASAHNRGRKLKNGEYTSMKAARSPDHVTRAVTPSVLVDVVPPDTVKKSTSAWTSVASRLWSLAWPLSGMEVLTFTKELIITAFVGHLGPLELSSLVLAQTFYNVTGNAPMLGIITAMETFCGQAFGAKRYPVLGTVLQRALVIVTLFNLGCILLWSQTERILLAMGQDHDISQAAARFTMLLAPCLLLDGVDQCFRRYLAAQSVVQPLMFVTFFATMLTPFYLWFFIIRCDWGFDGAAVAWSATQGTSAVGLVLFTLYHNSQQDPGKRTWVGFTKECLQDWPLYIKVAIPSAVMICLDWWTFEVIVMLSGLLPRPEVTMSMMGITFNIHALCFFMAHGLSGAASTRVGNELGAERPRQAWLNTQVSVMLGTVAMMGLSGALLAYRNHLGALFTSDTEVIVLTGQAVPTLAMSLIGEGANTVIAGVLRGCGRQKIGANVNLFMYWGIGLPFSCLLAFKMGLGAMGLWTGLACTASLQSLYLSWVVFTFDWTAEAQRARALIAAGELEIELDEEVEIELLDVSAGSTTPTKKQSSHVK